MNEIKTIKFVEIKSQRKKYNFFVLLERKFYKFLPRYVYNNGKRYLFEIEKINGEVTKIPYFSLYKCKNIKTIERFEEKIKKVIDEFNNYKYKNYFKDKYKN